MLYKFKIQTSPHLNKPIGQKSHRQPLSLSANQKNSASVSGKVKKRLDLGRSKGKAPPSSVELVYKKLNPRNLDIQTQISTILFIKNTTSVPSNDEIKELLLKFNITPKFIEVFKHEKMVTHAKLRLTHPSLTSLSIIFGPEMGLCLTCPKKNSIIARIELARSGH